MSKAKLAAARELINEHQYATARAILKTVHDPIATRWLTQLDRIDPPIYPAPAPLYPHAFPTNVIPQPISTDAEQFYRAENRKRQRRRIGTGLEFVFMGIVAIAIAIYLANLPKPVIPGGPPPSDTFEYVLGGSGLLMLLVGLVTLGRNRE
jgi:hypothetical protein